jgi:uncharacterized membrane protein YqhA
LDVPVIPTQFGLIVFVVLFVLLVLKEILRALDKLGSRKWRVVSNSLIGLLLVVYGTILLSRFLNLM